MASIRPRSGLDQAWGVTRRRTAAGDRKVGIHRSRGKKQSHDSYQATRRRRCQGKNSHTTVIKQLDGDDASRVIQVAGGIADHLSVYAHSESMHSFTAYGLFWTKRYISSMYMCRWSCHLWSDSSAKRAYCFQVSGGFHWFLVPGNLEPRNLGTYKIINLQLLYTSLR